MSTSKNIKPILKKGSTGNKTKKRVIINTNMNEGFIQIPEPITPINKSMRWTTVVDEKLAREEVRNKKARFLRARKETPAIAAMTARRKYKIHDDDHIDLKRTTASQHIADATLRRSRSVPEKKSTTSSKGPISSAVSSVFGFFRRRGGNKTRKNRTK
jgi:adenylyl- and sulfurtransferase ThiI